MYGRRIHGSEGCIRGIVASVSYLLTVNWILVVRKNGPVGRVAAAEGLVCGSARPGGWACQGDHWRSYEMAVRLKLLENT